MAHYANPRRLALVVGARPNFVKAAPILHALEGYTGVEVVLVHTGQHYDPNLSDIFFAELQMKAPDVHLHVGSGSHAVQTANIMIKFEEFLLAERSAGRSIDRVVVVGDVNSTVACSMVAAKLDIPVAHVEAGLRSFDRTMPEEVNRLVTDALSDLLLCSEPSGVDNLLREGHAAEKVRLVGNVMIDTLFRFRRQALDRPVLADLGLLPGSYGLVTLHRPANVDNGELLSQFVRLFAEVAQEIPLVFAVHPRTADRLERFGLATALADGHVKLLGPQGYVDFLSLSSQAKFIMTDSGGLQEEATALGVPCLTLRANTERPITVEEGTSILVGSDVDYMRGLIESILDGEFATGECPALWDGRAGARIADELAQAMDLPVTESTPRLVRAA